MIERRENIVFIIMIVFWLKNTPFGLDYKKRNKRERKSEKRKH
jgi:hypothetical protein